MPELTPRSFRPPEPAHAPLSKKFCPAGGFSIARFTFSRLISLPRPPPKEKFRLRSPGRFLFPSRKHQKEKAAASPRPNSLPGRPGTPTPQKSLAPVQQAPRTPGATAGAFFFSFPFVSPPAASPGRFPFFFPFLVSRLLFPFLFSFSPRAPVARPAPKRKIPPAFPGPILSPAAPKKEKEEISPFPLFSFFALFYCAITRGTRPAPKREIPPAFPDRFLFPARPRPPGNPTRRKNLSRPCNKPQRTPGVNDGGCRRGSKREGRWGLFRRSKREGGAGAMPCRMKERGDGA